MKKQPEVLISSWDAARIVDSDSYEIQRWIDQGKLHAAKERPGRGRSRMFTADQVIQFAVMKQFTRVGLPISAAARYTSVLADCKEPYVVIVAATPSATEPEGATENIRNFFDREIEGPISCTSIESVSSLLQKRHSAIFINLASVRAAVLERISLLRNPI